MIGSKEWDWRGLEWIGEIDERGVEQGNVWEVGLWFSVLLCAQFSHKNSREILKSPIVYCWRLSYRNHRSYTVGDFRIEITDRILLETFEVKSPIVYRSVNVDVSEWSRSCVKV